MNQQPETTVLHFLPQRGLRIPSVLSSQSKYVLLLITSSLQSYEKATLDLLSTPRGLCISPLMCRSVSLLSCIQTLKPAYGESEHGPVFTHIYFLEPTSIAMSLF